MSAQSVARWNAIPMERPQDEFDNTLKRSRDAMDEDESDDNISLVSRTPSPPPQDQMDVDKYDEYSRGVEREIITVDTKISSSNKGFAMLAKLGWVEGQPLGLSADGRVDPVPFVMKNDFTGLGKNTQDVRMIETTVSQRRELDSERQTKETEDQRKAREESVAKRHAVQSEITNVLRAFYCELCDKQFQNVAQYDEHTNSYAHHHKARLRDMQAAQRVSFSGDADKRKEKEKKREEKELRKIAKAAGIKMAKQPSTLGSSAPGPSVVPQDVPKKGGWATVGSSSFVAPGATSVGTAATGGWAPVSQPPVAANVSHSNPAPAFRTAGWTSLDASSTHFMEPTPPLPPSPTPPSQSAPRGGWTTTPTPTRLPPTEPPHPSPAKGGWSSIAQPQPAGIQPAAESSTAPVVQPTQLPLPRAAVPPSQPAAQRQEAARSGWQQFKAGGSRRR